MINQIASGNHCNCVCVCACACVSVYLYVHIHICTISRIIIAIYICVCVFHYSEFSDSVTYACAAAAPEAPPAPECVDVGVRHITVRWSSPDDNGGIYYNYRNTTTLSNYCYHLVLYTPAPITSYKLEMEDEETVSLCTGAKQLLHCHLKNL